MTLLAGLAHLGLVPFDCSAQSPAKAALKPFYVDSTYDRFKDEHRVVLGSRSAVASNGIILRWFTTCEPNSSCYDPAFHVDYGTNRRPSSSELKLVEVLSKEVTCFDFLFHRADDSVSRAEACFVDNLIMGPNKLGGTGVKRFDRESEYLQTSFRQAIWLESRIRWSSVEFRVPAEELRKLNAFWEEFDRRGHK